MQAVGRSLAAAASAGVGAAARAEPTRAGPSSPHGGGSFCFARTERRAGRAGVSVSASLAAAMPAGSSPEQRASNAAPALVPTPVPTVDELIKTTYGGGRAWLAEEADRLQGIQKGFMDELLLTRGEWTWEVREPRLYRLRGRMTFFNANATREKFILELTAKAQPLAGVAGIAGVTTTLTVLPRHNYEPGYELPLRADGFWANYVLEPRRTTAIELELVIAADASRPSGLEGLDSTFVTVAFGAYGNHGLTPQAQHVVLPLRFSPPPTPKFAPAPGGVAMTAPVRTHILCHLDDPVEVVRRYVLPHAAPGDVLAIAETPLAIMEGRIRHPASIRPGWIARTFCGVFATTSSCATACGFQCLIDLVGAARVLLALALGVLGKCVGLRGVFYMIAGEQSQLIDDVTGTLPPYDQFITLGPGGAQEAVDAIRARTGVEAAIVDVNDLSFKRGLYIVAASAGVDRAMLKEALKRNPAGNADQQTPLVLVRPLKK